MTDTINKSDQPENVEKVLSDAEKIINEAKAFGDYYAENIEWLTNQQKKLKEVSDSIEENIKKMMTAPSPRSMALLGQQQENLIALYAQQNAVATQLFNIKKAIIDYTIKTKPKKDDDSINNVADIFKHLRLLGKIDNTTKKQYKKEMMNHFDKEVDSALDEAIDAQLENID